jgi:hypothetical protein
MLVGTALAQNPRLENIRGTKFMKELSVPGILNTPRGKAKTISTVLKACIESGIDACDANRTG